jgi:hypothetical protein
MKLFGSTNHYFDNFKEEFDKFKMHHMLNKLDIEDSEEYFDVVKDELSKIDIATNTKLSNTQVRKILVIQNSSSFDDYKHNMAVRSNHSMAKKNQKLEKKLEKAKKLNSELTSSSSWKFTKPLRNFMDKLK